MSFSIINKTRQSTPRVPFDLIKNKVLPKNYELSLVFCRPALSRRLNKTLRGKDKPTNILSFPLSKTSGEIFIDLTQARKEYKNFEMTFTKFVTFLYIHGLLHLKGMEHGDKMDRAERKLLTEVFPKLKNGSSNYSGD